MGVVKLGSLVDPNESGLSLGCMQVLFVLAYTRIVMVFQAVLLFNVSFGVALIRAMLFQVRMVHRLLTLALQTCHGSCNRFMA